MRVTKITANLAVGDTAAARTFYTGLFGLDVGFDLGWVVNLHPPGNDTAGVNVVSGDATAPADSQLTIGVSDVDEAYELARGAGHEIVHPLTRESWGVRRFFVRSPDGTVINVAQHDG